MQKTIDKFGGLNGAVNCAGVAVGIKVYHLLCMFSVPHPVRTESGNPVLHFFPPFPLTLAPCC